MKLQNSKDKEKILKTTREKAQITYSETIVTLIAIMLSATIKAERLKISIKMLKYVNLEFYTPGNFSKCENRIKTFLKKAAAAAAKSLQSCLTLCDPIDGSPPGSPVPGDSPGKNTGVGCQFLLQCMKMKSESEVAQSCPTLSDPMDYSPPGSSVHGICQAIVLEWGAIAFSI